MFNQYFGQYLLNKGLLSSEQLCDVLVYEQSVRTILGVIAMGDGLMSAEQVEKVLQIQHKYDKRFGEIAVTEGYLTTGQLDELLQKQQRRHMTISQAIIDRGYLSLSQLETVLQDYKTDNLLNSELLDLRNCDYQGTIRNLYDLSVLGSQADCFCDYIALTMRNLVRFMRIDPFIDGFATSVEGYLIKQNVTGELEFSTCVVVDESTMLNLARRYSGEDLNIVNDLTKDCIAEFLNENNGLFIVNMSDRGLELDLQPQYVSVDGIETLQNYYRVPIRGPHIQFDLYVGFK